QLLLADIVGPAPARLADAAAHHQHVDDAAVVHVHVVPVVQPGADDDHGTALGLLGILGKLTRYRDDLRARDAADFFRPRWSVWLHFVIAPGDVLAAKAAIDTVIRREQVEHRGDQNLALGGLQL